MSVSIGELEGTVSLEDRFSRAFEVVGKVAESVFEEMEGGLKTLAIASGAVVTAITGIASTITYLGVKGSEINDLEHSFERLAGGVERADEIMKAMNKGVADTVDSMDLLKFANKALETGAVKTAEQFGTVTAAARVLSREGFGPIEGNLNRIQQALATGRVRSLQYMIGVVDLKKAEEQYAKSIGTTRDQLSAAGKLHADQIAIFERLNKKVEEAGDLQKSFAEKFKTGRLAIANWFDEVAKAVAASPSVNRAIDAIGDALVRNFGGAGQTALEVIVGWINRFADGVAYYGPIIIDWMGKIWQWIVDIWHTVQNAWSLVPDWFKNIAKDAALAAVAVKLVQGAFALPLGGGGNTLGDVASMATIISGFQSFLGLAPKVIEYVTTLKNAFALLFAELAFAARTGGAIAVLEGIALTIGEIGALIAASPLFTAAVWAVAIYGVYKVGAGFKEMYDNWKEGKSMWDYFRQGGGFWDNSFIGRQLGMSKVPTLPTTKSFFGQGFLAPGASPTGPGGNGLVDPGDLIDNSKKIEDATKASIGRTTQLWDQYFQTVDKMSGDALGAQIRGIDRWFDAEMTALDKSKKLNANYWNERTALVELHLAKIEEAITTFNMKVTEKNVEQSRDLAEAAQAAVSKSFGGGQKILEQMAQTTARFGDSIASIVEEAESWSDAQTKMASGIIGIQSGLALSSRQINTQIGLIGTTSTEVGQRVAAAMTAAQRSMLPLNQETKDWIHQLEAAGYTAAEIAGILGVSLKQVQKEIGLTAETFAGMLDEWASVLTQMAQVGGDKFGGIVQEIAQVVVAWSAATKAAQAYRDANTKTAKAFALAQGVTAVASATGQGSTLGRTVGGALAGGQVGMAVGGPIGAIVGAGIGGLVGLFRGISGPSKEEMEGRKVIESFESRFKDAKDMINSVGDAYETLGKSRAQARADIEAAWKAEKEGAEATTEAVNKLEEALKRAAEIDSAISGLGIKSRDELMHAADIANAAYEKIAKGVETGQFTAEDAAKAYMAYQQALAATGDAAAKIWVEAHKGIEDFAQMASDAGFQSIEDLQKAADQARRLAEYMRDSGKYSAGQVEDAFEAAAEAQSKAMGLSSKTMDTLKGKYQSLINGIADEAPEKVMGATEKAAREQLSVIEKQMKDEQMRLGATAEQAAKMVEDALNKIDPKHVRLVVDLEIEAPELPDDVEKALGGLLPRNRKLPPIVPEKEGGEGRVTGPTLFYSAGNEDYKFSGEGRSFKSDNEDVLKELKMLRQVVASKQTLVAKVGDRDVLQVVTRAAEKYPEDKSRFQDAFGIDRG